MGHGCSLHAACPISLFISASCIISQHTAEKFYILSQNHNTIFPDTSNTKLQVNMVWQKHHQIMPTSNTVMSSKYATDLHQINITIMQQECTTFCQMGTETGFVHTSCTLVFTMALKFYNL